mmetsp:Transcript_101143/g.281841  ORF Transcript_101143/g.281841 Transcript_101143/m.281841 type:complete len:220 (-) Transcript_101143:86-745(-)
MSGRRAASANNRDRLAGSETLTLARGGRRRRRLLAQRLHLGAWHAQHGRLVRALGSRRIVLGAHARNRHGLPQVLALGHPHLQHGPRRGLGGVARPGHLRRLRAGAARELVRREGVVTGRRLRRHGPLLRRHRLEGLRREVSRSHARARATGKDLLEIRPRQHAVAVLVQRIEQRHRCAAAPHGHTSARRGRAGALHRGALHHGARAGGCSGVEGVERT